jgi:hypothetical protein
VPHQKLAVSGCGAGLMSRKMAGRGVMALQMAIVSRNSVRHRPASRSVETVPDKLKFNDAIWGDF